MSIKVVEAIEIKLKHLDSKKIQELAKEKSTVFEDVKEFIDRSKKFSTALLLKPFDI